MAQQRMDICKKLCKSMWQLETRVLFVPLRLRIFHTDFSVSVLPVSVFELS